MSERIQWSKEHCGVILCPYESLAELMPSVVPIIDDLVATGELEKSISEYLIDVKVHMLMPNQYSCIPDWHCDFVPRNNVTKEKEPWRITGEKMYLWVSGEPRTEFREPPKIVHGLSGTPWVEFTQNDWHRGVVAKERTWRCFIRLTPKCLIEGRPTGNYDDSHRGALRRHSQVYLDSKSFEW
jgi:hypothetical protein